MPESKLVVPYKNRKDGKKAQVADMFNSISPKYDLLNRVLSFGIDAYWRRRAVAQLAPANPKTVLDIATGTADFAIEALTLKPERIVGVDISEGMLAYGREKLQRKGLADKIELRLGDSEKLPFSDNSFEAVIVSFGVRNFENLERGLLGMHRVCKPGGTCVILEFSTPRRTPMRQLYAFYSYRILPLVGRLVSKDNRAYSYLPESVRAFPDGEAFAKILEKVGFSQARAIPLTFGICSIYIARK